MKRAVLTSLATNLILLTVYMVASALEWKNVLSLSSTAGILWTPLRTTIWISSTSSFDGRIVDGVLLINNWSFIVLIAIIAVNLFTIWKMEKMSHE